MLSLYDDTKPFSFHIELTDGCNARCPACARNQILSSQQLIQHPNLASSSITLNRFKKIFKNYQQQTRSIVFSGNFGDPVFNPQFANILKYTIDNILIPDSKHSNVITCTNGGMRSHRWWSNLAKDTKKENIRNEMVFAIDGLTDTNHIYRVNTRFDRVIDNAKAWIGEGGEAQWQWIRFDHNKHQEQEAREFAKEIGFKSFQVVNSSRASILEYIFKDKHYKVIPTTEVDLKGFNINSEEKDKIKEISTNSKEFFNNPKKNTTIKCTEQELNRIYIDCEGFIYPCCWIGTHQYHKRNNTRTVYHSNRVLETMSFEEKDKAWNRNFIDILHDVWFEYILPSSWDTDPCSICKQNCGKKSFRTDRQTVKL